MNDCVALGDQPMTLNQLSSASPASPMTGNLLHAFRENPEIAIFLSIAIGTVIGRIKLVSFFWVQSLVRC
uniref:hypothetical protein n=1 Tax=Orrella sp. TaxID=1921583 RepID=UPI0040476601